MPDIGHWINVSFTVSLSCLWNGFDFSPLPYVCFSCYASVGLIAVFTSAKHFKSIIHWNFNNVQWLKRNRQLRQQLTIFHLQLLDYFCWSYTNINRHVKCIHFEVHQKVHDLWWTLASMFSTHNFQHLNNDEITWIRKANECCAHNSFLFIYWHCSVRWRHPRVGTSNSI